MFKQKANKRNLSVCVWVRTHLLILVCVCEWELTSRFQCVSEWELTFWFECVCVWVGENSPPHLCLWVRERTHLPSALPSNHTSNNLLANRILDGRTDGQTPEHTQEDTHYTEWYPLRTHPRGYPLHWVIPIITLSDTDTLSDFSSHWQFSQPTQEFTHYTKGPCFPHKQIGHWVIPMTLRDTPDTKWYPLP